MDLQQRLRENINTFLKSANLVYDTKDYTSATILYFKAMFSVLDYFILSRVGKAPKDHEERFRILQSDFPDMYKVLDNLFPIYRESYRASISYEKCKEVKKNVEKLVERSKAE